MITLGIDVGSLTTKSLIMEESNKFSCNVLPTGEDVSDTAVKTIKEALEKAQLSLNQIDQIVATGAGRSYIPYPAKLASEIRCDAVGSRFIHPSVKGIIDIGAENCRVVKCDPRGNVVDFVLNDKCAAGTGIFLETMAKLLQITHQELEEIHRIEPRITIASTCAVFAESEVVSQIHKGGINRLTIWKGVNHSVATRIYNLVARLHIDGEIVVVGGGSRNADLIHCLEEMIGSKLLVPPMPQIIGALGGAIIARDAVS